MSLIQASSAELTHSSPKGRALQSLRGLLERGELREGDRLPAESKLAAQFAVSRMTLRSALDVLEREGLVRREPNVGCVRSGASTSLMARTVVMLSDHQPATSGRVFDGSSAAVVSGVMDGVSRQAMNFLRLNPTDNNDQWLRDLILSRPAGVVLSCWRATNDWQADVVRQLSAARIPIVSWGDEPVLAGYDTVGSDHASGTAALVELLARKGKRRIARVWTARPELPWLQARNRGYEKAVQALGLESIAPIYADGLTEREPITETSFKVRVRQFAGYLAEYLHSEDPIDAIMVVTDCETAVAMAACRLFGRTDVAVTGYDNYWQTLPERQWEPTIPVATVDKNNHRLGERMADLLLQRISGKLTGGPQHVLLEQAIVDRFRN